MYIFPDNGSDLVEKDLYVAGIVFNGTPFPWATDVNVLHTHFTHPFGPCRFSLDCRVHANADGLRLIVPREAFYLKLLILDCWGLMNPKQ